MNDGDGSLSTQPQPGGGSAGAAGFSGAQSAAQSLAVLGDIERHLQALNALRAEWEQQSAEQLRRESALRELESQLRERALAIEHREREEESRRAELQREAESAKARAEELDRQAQHLSEREAALNGRLADVQRLETEVLAKLDAAAAKESSLGEREASLAATARALEEREQELARRSAEVQQREAAAGEEDRQARETVKALRQRLEEMQHEIAEAEQRIDEERQHWHMSVRDAESRVVLLQGQTEELRGELSQWKSRAEQAESALKASQQSGEILAKLRLDAAEQGQAVQRLEAELARVKAELTEANDTAAMLRQRLAAHGRTEQSLNEETARQISERDAQIAELREQLAQARSAAERLQRERSSLEDTRTGLEAELQRRERELTEHIAASRTNGRSREWNELRKRRLIRCRDLLHERATKLLLAKKSLAKRDEDLKAAAARLQAEAEQERNRLVSLRKELEQRKAALEAQLERAASAKKKGLAGLSVFALVASLVLAGAACWLLSGRVMPATYLSAVTIAIDPRGANPTSEQVEAWQGYHERLLGDPQFLEKAAERMKARGFKELSTPSDVRRHFEVFGDTASPSPGELTISLRGRGGDRTARILETYATALVSLANSTRDMRSDKSSTVIAARAEADEQPLEDPRMAVFGAMFGAASALVLITFVLVWRKVGKTSTAAAGVRGGSEDEAVLIDLPGEAAPAEAEAPRKMTAR